MMRPLTFDTLFAWIVREFREHQSIFGIHRSLFWEPRKDSRCGTPDMFGQYLATPIGPAAGPHTQLAQNIVCAWLSGGRFIELKTVQVLDALEIPRPCIDMEDEGYNVEWSQELSLEQSASEYAKAWALVHILHRMLGFEARVPPGTIFNLSVGYNLEGIKSPAMSRFMECMRDSSEELARIRDSLRWNFREFADVAIPQRISNNVTLSTMHGCPPEEIGNIARYLLEEQGLHTTVKLNPTLLGKERLLGILHGTLGFKEVRIPDSAFEHDLKYEQAVELIRSLKKVAAACGRSFGIKLSNTLAASNHKFNLPGGEMYMSGRALYPITMSLFHKLASEFGGDLNVSFSGGADALNVAALLSAGARPVTVATDLLKPGGYSRLLQYLERLDAVMNERGAANLDALSRNAMEHLARSAAEALEDRRYRKSYSAAALPKVASGLGLFDCITAPCVAQCAVRQDVPEYIRLIGAGEYDRALEVILSRNPLPAVTGYVCTQLCQSRCTRSAGNYDAPVAIRALKRFADERGRASAAPLQGMSEQGGRNRRVAIIGAGPSGLSAGCFLALNGIRSTIFEARSAAGGMMRFAPSFRLPSAVIQEDVDRIAGMGVEIRLSHRITQKPESLLEKGFDAVYVASGLQKNTPLTIEGVDGDGVVAALDLLEKARRGERVALGARVLVIGGGDTALDAARVARRMTGGSVAVIYRRTAAEMPAGDEDCRGAFEEGIELMDLTSPTRVVLKKGRVAGLECVRNRPGDPEADGRRRPVAVPGSEFRIAADSVVVAVGQSPDLAFLGGSAIRLDRAGSIAAASSTGRTEAPHVYAGGDAVGGPESIIAAAAAGRRAAEAICGEFGVPFEQLKSRPPVLSDADVIEVKQARARKSSRRDPAMIPPGRRGNFDLIESTLDETSARAEAARCLMCSQLCDKCVEVCPNRANQAYRVSPVRIAVPVLSCRDGGLCTAGIGEFRVDQSRQIVHLHDLCNECGNCATFCVHSGKPYLEKPRLFFDRQAYEREDDNAFLAERGQAGWMLRRREKGTEARLQICGDSVVFENDCLRAVLSAGDWQIRSADLRQPFEGDLSLAPAAEMCLILRGLLSSLPFPSRSSWFK